MGTKLEDTAKAARLFEDWQESILYACLQKTMGAIYADDPEHPKSAMAMLGDFCFLPVIRMQNWSHISRKPANRIL